MKCRRATVLEKCHPNSTSNHVDATANLRVCDNDCVQEQQSSEKLSYFTPSMQTKRKEKTGSVGNIT